MFVRGVIVVLILNTFSLLSNTNWHFSQDLIQETELLELTGPQLRAIKREPIHELFTNLHKRNKFNGAALVIQKGAVLYKGVFGNANFRKKEPLSIHSAFQLASVSKIFTATAVMKLEEEGKLDIADPIAKHISGWPYEKMKIQDLLRHRSGMARYMAVASWYWKNPKKNMDNRDVLKQYIRHKPITFFRPNRNFNYCNTNYVILASLVEAVSGKPFNQYMREEIFEPLEMVDAMIYSRKTNPPIPNEAIGYKAGWKGYYRAPNDYIDGVWGDKNMFASIEDILKFERAWSEGRVLKPETIEKVYTPGSKWRRYNYGLGWRIKTGENPLYYHFGWWRGYRTCYIRDVKNEFTMVLLSNKDHPGRNVKYWNLYEKILQGNW